MILDGTHDMTVVGEAADGLHALTLVAETGPDVVLMDVRMPGIDGIEATRRLRAAHPPDEPPDVIILTSAPQLQDQRECGLGRSGLGVPT
jgi:CheY-like chemotaxis protein